jgi:uncharacterized glyoxalase superfamily protein PhnB
MQYRELGPAVDWLARAFGFEVRHAVRSDDGTIAFAIVGFSDGLIMLGQVVRGGDLDGVLKQPDETGGAETQSCYGVVDDADAHCDRAKAAGAAIVFDVSDYHLGGRTYTCRDPEGHIWSFGTYDPSRLGSTRRTVPLMPTAVAVLAVAATAGWLMAAGLIATPFGGPSPARPPVAALPQPAPAVALDRERDAVRQRVERALAEAVQQGATEREARERTERAYHELSKRVAEQRQAREHTERLAHESRENVERERDAAAAVEQRLRRAQQELDRQRLTVEMLQQQLRAEEHARKDAERAVALARKRLAELEAARESTAAAAPPSALPTAPVPKQAPKPTPREVTRGEVEPMPPFVP